MVGGRKKILYVNGTGEMSGAEVSLLTLIANLDRERFQPLVALPWHGRFSSRLTDEDIPVVTMEVKSLTLADLGPFGVVRNAARALPFIRALRRFLHQSDIALIHVNSYRIGIPCGLAARLAQVPVVWHVRDIATTRLKRWGVDLSARLLADQVVAISQAVAARLAESSSKVVTIYNGIDTSPFSEARGGPQVREELGIAPGTLVIGNVGQLVPWKGQDLLIEAIAEVSRVLNDLRLLLVGYEVPTVWALPEGYRRYPARLRDLVQDLDLDGTVTFTGFRDDIASVMDAFDLYVHTAVRPEPFGRVLVEAMATGIPVVAPRAGGVPEIVDHGRTGLLFPQGDKHALRDAMVTLATDRAKRQAMGREAARVAQERFTVQAYVEQVETLYAELLGGTS